MAEARILYVATADGLVQLANPGKSDRWREVGRALTGQALWAVAASPADPLLVYAAGTAGIARSTNGGLGWQLVHAEPIRALAIDQSGVVYAGSERGVVLSSGDGTTWNEADACAGPVVQLAPGADGRLLVVGGDGTVCQQSDSGWVPREMHVPQVRGLAPSSADPRTLFVVNQTALITSHGAHPLPASPTGALLVLGGGSEVLLIATQGALLRSEDGGQTLAVAAGPENVTVLVTPPRFVDQVFAGTESGSLWFSSDRARSWRELRAGDPPVRGIAFARAL